MGQWANLFISPQRARGRAIIGIEAGNLRATCGQLAYEEANKSGQSSAFACSALFVTCGQLAGKSARSAKWTRNHRTAGIEASGRAIIEHRASSIEVKTTDPQKSQVTQPGLPGTFMSLPNIFKNRKTTHTRSTQDPQRPKTRKVACRAGLQSIWHARSTRSTRST